ncbi:MAG TPA: hypothetical protein VGG21_00725 [Acidimicrobiales bacterium]|jgi:hypothetical protein
MSELAHLNGRHRDTLLQIFQHPTSHNVEWHDVLSLLNATAEVQERHDGKFHVRLGEASHTLSRPKGKDVDVQQVVDLRKLFTQAGYDVLVQDLEARGRED